MHLKSASPKIFALTLLLSVRFAPIACISAEARSWAQRNGHRFDAELLAADGWRATFGIEGAPKWVIPFSELTVAGVEDVQTWRRARRERPLVDSRMLAPWPAEAVAAESDTEVRAAGEDAGEYRYESGHFSIVSDVKLPVSVVRDLALVFEGTRSALIALPLGLHAGGETRKYPVLLTASGETYGRAGGAEGSGGFYDARRGRMVVFLPNLGIEQKAKGTQLKYEKQLFVLKHEVTHQLLARWNAPFPAWLNEGLPEFIASLPYSRGRYTLQNPGAGMRDYLLKWRQGPSSRTVRLVPPKQLMRMEADAWNAALARGAAYDLYNSANLLTFYFIQQRGGAPIATFVESWRRGDSEETIEKELLGGRDPSALTADLVALGRRLAIEVKVAE